MNLRLTHRSRWTLAARFPVQAKFIRTSLVILLATADAFGAGNYAQVVLADGPIAYWRFNDATQTALNSGSLGAAANGTYFDNAAPGAQAPRPPSFYGFETNNTALQLDGSGDFVRTMWGLMDGRSVFTISGWFRRNGDQPIRTGLWGQNDLIEIGYITNDTIQVWSKDYFQVDISPNPFPNGRWAHLAVVSDASPLLSVYTNGQFAGSIAHVLPGLNGLPFDIGSDSVFGSGSFFNGQIDEVAVFDKALSAETIASHYFAATDALQTGPINVTTTSNHDDGRCTVSDCTLLEAINAANAAPDTNTIRFEPWVSGTITNSSLLNGYAITSHISIIGPGADRLALSGNRSNRVFRLSSGALTLTGLTITNGHAADYGGGILAEGGTLVVSACHIVSNVADFAGGGVYIRSNATAIIQYSSVFQNEGHIGGGGIMLSESGNLAMYACTIASNRTTFVYDGIFPPSGGGIWTPGGTLLLVDSTVSGNHSTLYGGGICNGVFFSGSVTIRNCIVAGNTSLNAGPDVVGSFNSIGYNLIGNTNTSTGFGATGDQLNVNPLLGPLGNYGGPTRTMALRAGSPAMDKGNGFGTPVDQRVFPRPLDDPTISNASGGDGSDIGAFEVDPRFRIVNLSRVGDDVGLSLMTVLGKNYRAEYTNDLASGTWTAFTNNAPGNGYLLWVTNAGGANQAQRFYRGSLIP